MRSHLLLLSLFLLKQAFTQEPSDPNTANPNTANPLPHGSNQTVTIDTVPPVPTDPTNLPIASSRFPIVAFPTGTSTDPLNLIDIGCDTTTDQTGTISTLETPDPTLGCIARFGHDPNSVKLLLRDAPRPPPSCAASGLEKRNVPEPGANLDKFIGDCLSSANTAGNILVNRVAIIPDQLPFADGRQGFVGLSSSARLVFGAAPLTAALAGMKGCTVVFVIGKRGVWFAHLWEGPAMTTFGFNSNGEVIGYGEPDPRVFFNDVINFIPNGDGPGNPGLQADTKAGGILNTDILKILIITPRFKSISAPMDLRHADSVSRVIAIVNAAFPHTPGITADIVDYIAVDAKRTRDGTIILQYDPQQNTAGTTQALVRMYVSGDKLPDITWDPLPNQRPPQGKRQVFADPACTPVPTTMIKVPAPDPAGN